LTAFSARAYTQSSTLSTLLKLKEPFMSTTLRGPISPPPAAPRRRPVTRAEYERLIDLGFFGPDERLELIEGEIIEKMTQNAAARHRNSPLAKRAYARISRGFSTYERNCRSLWGAEYAGAGPGRGGRSFEDYEEAHPTTAVLVIEISDSTLVQDRTIKAGLYASAGHHRVLVDERCERLLEVFRDPAPLAGQRPATITGRFCVWAKDDAVSPLTAPGAVIPVAQFVAASSRYRLTKRNENSPAGTTSPGCFCGAN
jgi:Uma2 family endonuclease